MAETDNKTNLEFSIVIPAYNEEEAVFEVIGKLKEYLKEKKYLAEIIVVNDGSTDKTGQILDQIPEIKVIHHPYNKGYGAALKTGTQQAQTDWVLFYDSDGQHQPEFIERLLPYRKNYEMIVGERTTYRGPFWRKPGKKILKWLAEYLVQHKIPDLNSGLRLIKKDFFKRTAHLLPNSFSLSTTITLVFLKQGYNVKYVPIEDKPRLGRSKVKVRDGFNLMLLILKTIILFSPLRIFLPVSFALLFGAGVVIIYDLLHQGFKNPHDLTILLLTFSGLIIFFFGLIADQIATLRREIKL